MVRESSLTSQIPLQQAMENLTDISVPQGVNAASAVTAISDFSKGFSRGDGQEAESGQGEAFFANDSMIASQLSESKDGSRVRGNFETTLTGEAPKPEKSQMAQRLVSQAEMLLRKGGGSMRVDMEAPGIGRIDVAINLNNNQLDVRIITASEQARDMISHEISGLRDGLNQQGISLRGIEIAKAGQSSSGNHFGQQHQGFGQHAQGERPSYNDMREYAQSFRNSYKQQTLGSPASMAPSMAVMNRSLAGGMGRLAVRI